MPPSPPRAARRERDVLALMSGLLFVAVAGTYLLTSTTSLTLSGRWLLPVVLLGIGGAGLLASLRGETDRGEPELGGPAAVHPFESHDEPDGEDPDEPDVKGHQGTWRSSTTS